MEKDNNEIIEIFDGTETKSIDISAIEKEEELIVSKKKKSSKKHSSKSSKEFFYKKLDKKGKIIFWLIVSAIILLISFIILYFCVLKKDNKKVKKEEENIVIEHDNYIYDNGKLVLLNSNGKEIGSYTCKEKDEKKCYVTKLSLEDDFDIAKYVDKKGEEIEQLSKIYNNRFVFITDNDGIVLYDLSSNTSSGDYKLLKTSSSIENLVVLKNSDDKYGVININLTSADILVDFKYDYLGIIDARDKFVATEGAYSYLINDKGESITDKVKGSIKKFSDKYLSVYDEKYILYDYTGKKALEGEYDYIDFYDNFVLTVKDNKLYIYSEDLIKLNEEGIKLKNNKYNTLYTVENDKVSKTEKAYTLSKEENNLRVILSENSSKVINTIEGIINGKLKYISYFDGILYFYADENKTDKIGSYTCTHKNDVKEASEMFENCFIAKESNLFYDQETIGYAPIINGSYAFINDTASDTKTKNIILYDLVNSSQKAKYQGVDTGVSTLEISSISSLNGLVVGKNQDANMGIITFGPDGPVGVIKFKEDGEGTKKISKMGDNLYVERDSTNFVYDKLGKKLATSKFKIISYDKGLTVVENSGKYILYKMNQSGESGEMYSQNLDYIKLEKDFFIGIEDDKLNIYKFEKSEISNGKYKNKILVDDIDLKSIKYKKEVSAEIKNDEYIINIKQEDGGTLSYKYNLKGEKVEDKKTEEKKENGDDINEE